MSKLQSYFDYYEKHYNPKSSPWYKSSNETFAIMRAIQERLPSIDVFNETEDKKDLLEKSFQKSNQNEIDSIQTFLQRFVFDQKNGVGNVSQGVVWASEPNPHKEQILNNATPELIYQVLSSRSKEEVLLKTNELLRSGRGYHAVQNRLMRILFPNEFAAADATNKFDRLVNILNNKLGVEINGSSLLEKHTDLCRRIDTEDAVLRQMFTWDLFYMLENEFTLKKAVCYYGAPGTGKTYRTSKEAEKLIDAQRILIGKDIESEYSIKTVQFHPSYSYEDFMEGIRPTQEGGLQLYNGSFKQFCKENGKKEINLYTQTDFLNNPNFKDVNYDLSRIKISQLDIKEKEALALKDMDYATGLTVEDVLEPAVFIIDEINRAELSKVFGELMYSLEYRGYGGKIKTQYSHLCSSSHDDSAFLWVDNENWFFIPHNVYLISTMNNIDRSVDAFDFALRRRFMWKEVHPNYNLIEELLSEAGWKNEDASKIKSRLELLNKKIEEDDILDKNYRIGHSYVLELAKFNPNRFDTLNDAILFIWDGFIEPLLEEYLKGLGNERKSEEKIQGFRTAFLK